MKSLKTTTGGEQRRFRRYAVSFPCVVRPRKKRKEGSGSGLHGETQDVSSGGLFFVASADWEIGTEIQCELRLPGRAFGGRSIALLCRGKIARVVPHGEGQVGIGATIEHYEFLRVSSEPS